jgi:protease-4
MSTSFPPEGGYQQPVQAVAVTPNYSPAPPRKSILGKIFLTLLLLAFFGSIMMNLLLIVAVGVRGGGEGESRMQEKHVSHDRWAKNKIAILSIEGVIYDGEGFFRRQLDRARQEAEAGNLKALVIRVNSPGGTICGSDYMLHHLQEFRKDTGVPVVVSMGALAASGGYYVSMAVGDKEDTIFAEPTTWTGSIGVIIPHYNLSGLLKEVGIEQDEIVSHRLKGMGTMARAMTEEEKQIFQSLVDDGFKRFKETVQSGRPKFEKDPAALDQIATGQIFTADQAVENGLVDRIGFIEDAVARAIELAGIGGEKVSVVRYQDEPTLADAILGGKTKAQASFDWAALLDSTSPRGYYLCTWLPILAGKSE